VSRKLQLAEGETSRTACARAPVWEAVDEKSGEVLKTHALAERVGWCADLVARMAATLVVEHWNTTDVDVLAAGVDAGGRKLPSNAWMALRRLGWSVACDAKVNDRIVRMAQEQAGRSLPAPGAVVSSQDHGRHHCVHRSHPGRCPTYGPAAAARLAGKGHRMSR
jgi:hypothetical protein